ncbi:pectin lyase-like protein [Aspergillus californicus]
MAQTSSMISRYSVLVAGPRPGIPRTSPASTLNTRGTSPILSWPHATNLNPSDSYTINIQGSKGEAISVPPFLATVVEVNTTSGKSTIHNTTIARFQFSGTADITLTYHTEAIEKAVIRPSSYAITPQVKGNKITFRLSTPKNIVVQINDNIWDTLNLFADPTETDIPDPNDPDVIYFHAGINNGPSNLTVTDDVLAVPSGKTVYVAGGAVLTYQVAFQNVSGSTIRGRGTLFNNPGGAVLIESSSSITVRDLVILNPNGYAINAGEADGLLIHGIRAFSSKGWGDGIDIFCSNNVLIEKVFMRNSDDNIALYQHRWGYYGHSSNITIQDATLWADLAHAIVMGTHGNTDNPETLDGVTIRNIDILDHREPQMGYQGAIAINPGDSNLVQNVYAEGIRVENFREGQVVNFRVSYNSKYNTSPGRGIRNVVIKGLSYEGVNANPALVLGYDEDRTIENVTFVDLTVNGELIYDDMAKPTWYYTADMVPMFVNEHVSDLTFVKSQ